MTLGRLSASSAIKQSLRVPEENRVFLVVGKAFRMWRTMHGV